ncbi:MAG: NADAR family protein [Baekduia sp.]
MTAQAGLFPVDEPIVSFDGEHRFLSNFAHAPIEMVRSVFVSQALSWWSPELTLFFPTVEHAFQAAKVEPATPHFAEHYRRIAEAPSPGAAKRLGSPRGFREHGATLRQGWDEIKVVVMLACLRKKFASSAAPGMAVDQGGRLPPSGLDRLLLHTGRRVLVEGNTWNDTYWGVCNGVGTNMLGRLLMLVRAELNCAAAAGLAPELLR